MIALGIAGLGAAGQAFLPDLAQHGEIALRAVADPSTEARAIAEALDGVSLHAGLDDMLADPELDAIYVGTPTDMHCDHVVAALRAGKHVLVEKPMAVSVADGIRMVEASEAARKVLAVGHSHSYDPPIRAMADVVASGRLGAVRMVHTWCYSDWVYRPRRPDELLVERGGGVTFRQGAHQFDIMARIVGAPAQTLSAATFDLDPNRSVIGAHTVTLRYAGGAVGTAVYNGYGHFSTDELTEGVGEWGFVNGPQRRAPKGDLSEAEELALKRKRAGTTIPAKAPNQPHFGLTVVSCEKGDMRQTPGGIALYQDGAREDIAIETGVSPRTLVLNEFADAISGRKASLHDGRWGLSVLEICAGAVDAGRSGQTVTLKHQRTAVAGDRT